MPSRRYTEESFRTALADPGVRTMADLCRALGIVPRGANYDTLRALGGKLGLDADRLLMLRWLGVSASELAAAADGATSMGELLRRLGLPDRSGHRRRLRLLLGDTAPDASPLLVGPDGRRARSYTDQQLLDALGVARNYGQLCDLLGLRTTSGTNRRLREHAARLGVPISPTWSLPGTVGPDGVPRRPPPPGYIGPPRPRFEVEDLRAAVAHAKSIAGAIRALGHEPSPTARRWFAQAIAEHDLDTSHFPAPNARGGTKRRPTEQLLVRGQLRSSTDLRRRLLDEGIKEARCEGCHKTRWRDQPIPLELDHVDGDRSNNLLENLRLLCPNCHALTPTYRGRNIGRRPGTWASLRDVDSAGT